MTVEVGWDGVDVDGNDGGESGVGWSWGERRGGG